MLATDELERLNTALVFINLILMDTDEIDELTVDDLILAAQSYVRSMPVHGLRPSAEAQGVYEAMHASVLACTQDALAMAAASSRRG
ncbi:MAG: hypothetical protein ABWY05_02985 [Noviherbaspirillum sp.]